ncbi:hypothetical protein [Winogradskyella sp.]|jgi:hypothetical protein|uniref:hypothetical protein n=1 Tax=Winogradskyella sp. TaxID=1883156 RepID=UPI0025F61233|nr:hypothetical protein [Winogradskyella sp.]MCT4629436.1 hypothetical protein [Winogradskyella sp.]
MKTLKITLTLIAITMLTVSSVQSDEVVNNDPTLKESSTHINLLAHKKSKIKAPNQS